MSNSANLSNVISIGKDDREVIRYPKFLKLIFFVEMWERFSYYESYQSVTCIISYITSRF